MRINFIMPGAIWQRIVFLCFICWSTHLFASTSNTTSANESPLPALGQIQVFEDVSGTMTLADINALYAESPLSFATAQQKRLKPGFTHSAWWLRVELSNHAATNLALVLALLDARLEHVDSIPAVPMRCPSLFHHATR